MKAYVKVCSTLLLAAGLVTGCFHSPEAIHG